MKRVRATCALAAGNRLGEGIVWCPRTQALYWTDIEAATLWRFRPADAATQTWTLPEPLACLALCEDDAWLLLGLASRLAFLHLPSGALESLAAVEADLPTRLNDGACDREGRFVFGTLHEPAHGARRALGHFYRLDADLSLHRLDLEPVAIANGLAFSTDGRTLYFCDSAERVIRCCDYGADGTVANVRDFADLRGESGEPDGATVDADGGLWSARWGAGRIVRYRADGRADRVVEVPARQPTRPAFGGSALDTLYVTSARSGLSAQALVDHAQDGHLFAAAVDAHGLPEARFAGVPRDTGRHADSAQVHRRINHLGERDEHRA